MKKILVLLAAMVLLASTNAIAAWYLEWDASTTYADGANTPIPAGKVVTYRAFQDNVFIANGITGTSVLLSNVGVNVAHVFEVDAKVDNVYSPTRARLDWTSPLVGPATPGSPRVVQR